MREIIEILSFLLLIVLNVVQTRFTYNYLKIMAEPARFCGLMEDAGREFDEHVHSAIRQK